MQDLTQKLDGINNIWNQPTCEENSEADVVHRKASKLEFQGQTLHNNNFG